MIPFTVFSFIVTIISFQRISATINDLVQISKVFDQYFNLPSDNNYTLDGKYCINEIIKSANKK